jgi:hypothetical protein
MLSDPWFMGLFSTGLKSRIIWNRHSDKIPARPYLTLLYGLSLQLSFCTDNQSYLENYGPVRQTRLESGALAIGSACLASRWEAARSGTDSLVVNTVDLTAIAWAWLEVLY